MKTMHSPQLSRRNFVLGATSTLALSGLPFSQRLSASTPSAKVPVQELRGNTFNLQVGYQTLNYTGKPTIATTVNGSLPAPVLRWKEGERVKIRVTNHLREDTSIHWHGIILPSTMDGSPGFDFDGIKPGETFEYEFDVKQNGTYWYHSHSGFQEQTGLLGAIIIEPKEPDSIQYDRDFVVLLSDWTDTAPSKIYSRLKKMSHYYNYRERTVSDTWSDIKNNGLSNTWNQRAMWNSMRMSDADIADVTGYTYLINGCSPAENWMALCKAGEKIRLRIINGAAMTIFDVQIPGLKMTVVAADGQAVQPVDVDEFRIGTAETYDVLVTLGSNQAFSFFAQTIDKSGFASATITTNPTLVAKVPPLDSAPILEHRDMGMAGTDHTNHESTSAIDHSQHQSTSSSSQSVIGPLQSTTDSASIDHSNHGAAAVDHSSHSTSTADHSGQDMSAMDHSQHGLNSTDHGAHQTSALASNANAVLAKAGFGNSNDNTTSTKHKSSEFGPQVDMRVENSPNGLTDPGVGLREHQEKLNRKVLRYSDLRNLEPTRDKREPSREIELHLNGNMHRYMWSIDGKSFSDAAPIELTYGERVRITLVNDTMMTHPIHLHGMWSELETGNPDFIPRKHTILVQPGSKISYLVTADAKGRWAYHCHLLYHMLGMMRMVKVS